YGKAFDVDDALEVRGKDAVVAVVVLFVLDQAHAGELVKIVQTAEYHTPLQRLQQREKFPDRGWDAALFQLEKKLNQHSKLYSVAIGYKSYTFGRISGAGRRIIRYTNTAPT